MDALASFSDPVRAWFSASFPEPTDAQAQAWPAIAAGEHTLLCAPTGSGKTLAAFLWALDDLGSGQAPDPDGSAKAGTRVLYVSPLRALAVDVDKGLRGPLRGISSRRNGWVCRTGSRRSACAPVTAPLKNAVSLVRDPPDILITTPESLYLVSPPTARETLLGVERIIVDEIHALAATKRGAHMALSLERLEHLLVANGAAPDPVRGSVVQRIDFSATQRPLEVVAGFLAGNNPATATPRPVRIVDAGVRKELDLQVIVPVDDMGALGEQPQPSERGATGAPGAGGPPRRSIWPSIHPMLLDLVFQHRSTLVFVNARRLAERLASRLNELAAEEPDAPVPVAGASGPAQRGARAFTGDEAVGLSAADSGSELVKAHHGSLSRGTSTSDRRRAEARRPPWTGRHQLVGARHRHGCGRPLVQVQLARQRGGGPPAHRAGGAPGRSAESRTDLPQAPC